MLCTLHFLLQKSVHAVKDHTILHQAWRAVLACSCCGVKQMACGRGRDACSAAAWPGAGNICYFNALLQCMLHTPHFVSILWQSFPEVEAPPPPPEHEPLSEWVPPLRPLAASSAASSDAPKPSPAKSTDGSTTPGRSVEGSEPSLSRASPPLSRASLKEVRSCPRRVLPSNTLLRCGQKDMMSATCIKLNVHTNAHE